MSVVGYILGLGDRHPSNLMIARASGQVVHIDFGDCFEIAAFRDKHPEKIPFRLTRMLFNALEVSGVEGNYRYTCELVMCLLRNNKDAVMTMLEAFVFDPLITWRLLPTHTKRRTQAGTVGFPTNPGNLAQDLALAAMSPLQTVFADIVTRPQKVAPGEAGAETEDSRPQREGDTSTDIPAVVPFHDRQFAAIVDGEEEQLESGLGGGRHTRQRELRQHLGPEGVLADPNLLSATARSVISRVYAKLTGTDFRRDALDVEAQVERLIMEAMSHENLCQCYVGWCPFW